MSREFTMPSPGADPVAKRQISDLPRTVLSSIPLPYESVAPNAFVEEAGEAMWEWADRSGLCPSPAARSHMERTSPHLWAAKYWPHADAGRLAVLAQWMFWTFVVDDEFDDGSSRRDPRLCAEVIQRFLHVLDFGPALGVLGDALADLWGGISPGRSAGWTAQFRRDFADWLWTYHAETVDRASGRLPNLDEFRAHRIASVGMKVFMDLSEVADGVDLPQDVRNLRSVVYARNAIAEYLGLHNDIRSFPKEWLAGYQHNVVWLEHCENALSWQSAVDAAVEALHGCVAKIERAESQLPGQLIGAAVPAHYHGTATATLNSYLILLRADVDLHDLVGRYVPQPDAPSYTPGFLRPATGPARDEEAVPL
jgi:(+)-beta-caryophyllene/(+)-caryolan-1-ol synthase